MPGPNWSDDQPRDAALIVANTRVAIADAADLGVNRADLTETDLKRWHSELYRDCAVPSSAYVGAFRGSSHPDVFDYQVGVGPTLADGYPDRVGVRAVDVADEVARFFRGLSAAFSHLDPAIPAGTRPTEVDLLHEVVALCAHAHGEWVRIHAFVNGNGRTARLIAAHVAVRYALPVFVTLKPRPHDTAYARASRASMGRPPDFVGYHDEATAVFAHLLALHLLR